jgi:hypothetical protein
MIEDVLLGLDLSPAKRGFSTGAQMLLEMNYVSKRKSAFFSLSTHGFTSESNA